VRAGGARHGAPVGMLVTQFDWHPQAAAVLQSLRFGDAALGMCAMITDDAGNILARRGGGNGARGKLILPKNAAGWQKTDDGLQGHHRTEGFETWAGKGWHGVVELSV
jgi:hypothetical protein